MPSRYDRVPEKPVVLTPEEVSEKLSDYDRKLGQHDQKLGIHQAFNIVLTLAVIVMAALLWFKAGPSKTHAVVHPNAVDSLTVRVGAVESRVDTISTKTEAGVIQQVRRDIAERDQDIENISARVTKLEDRVDRVELK